MSSSAYIACAIILLLCAIQVVAFVPSNRVFRVVNGLLLVISPATLAAAVALNFGYMLGAIEQSLAVPGPHRYVLTDPGGQPIPYAVIFCLIALAIVTLVLRFMNERRQRK